MCGYLAKLSFAVLVFSAASSTNVDGQVTGLRGQKKTDEGTLGIAFSGGGFRAHAVHTGVVAGLMGHVEGSGDERLSKLFKDVSLIGSNSGGSWFSAQLLHSPNFIDMMNDIAMAQNASWATQVYDKQWMSKFLDLHRRRRQLSLPDEILKVLEKIWNFLASSFGIVSNWSVIVLKYVLEGGLSWQAFVQGILEVPGDLDTSLSLSNIPSAPWCEDKIWAIAGVVVTSPQNPTFGSYNAQCTNDGVVETRSFTYNIDNAKQINHPITFSSKLGSPGPAPLSFIQAAEDWKITYDLRTEGKGGTWQNPWGTTIHSVSTVENAFGTELQQKSNMVSIGDSVATSSAFLGQVISVPAFLQGWDVILARMLGNNWGTLWKGLFETALYLAPGAGGQHAFSKTESLRRPSESTGCDEWINSVKSNSFVTIADGGYSDNTASAKLFGEGSADSVVLFLNIQDGDFSDLFSLFSADKGLDMELFTSYPIFKETKSFVQEQIKSFKALSPKSTSSVLNAVRYGTVEATTMDQPVHGVTGGRKVKVHVIAGDAKINIAALDWDVFPQVTGELQGVMVDQRYAQQIADDILPWFST